MLLKAALVYVVIGACCAAYVLSLCRKTFLEYPGAIVRRDGTKMHLVATLAAVAAVTIIAWPYVLFDHLTHGSKGDRT